MVIIQSLVDNLCRCICATDIPACGPFSRDGVHPADGDSASGDPRVTSKMMSSDGSGSGGVGHRSHLAEMQQQYNGGAMAGGLSTAESSGVAARAVAAAARLRGSVECGGGGGNGGGGSSLFRSRAGEAECVDVSKAGAGQGVPAAVSSDVSSRSSSSVRGEREEPAPPVSVRPVNSVETAEDREAKEALAEARMEAGRRSGRRHRRKSSSVSSSRAQSNSRSGKRKADIFRSRNNVRPANASNAALADDDECVDHPAEEEEDGSDDEIVGLGNHRGDAARGDGPGSIFMCSDPSSDPRNAAARMGVAGASRVGRMMLCFATPIHGSDSDDDIVGGGNGYHRYSSVVGGPCGPEPRDVEHSPAGGGNGRRGRKAARTTSPGEGGEKSERLSSRSARQDHHQGNNKVRTVADDLFELEAMEAERERVERREEALRNGDLDGLDDSDIECEDLDDILQPSCDADEMTAATNADDTVTSTLYFDAKLGQVVENTTPRPPVPLFQQFKVDVNEEKDDEIKRIIKSGSHNTLSIMQMWESSQSSSSPQSHHPHHHNHPQLTQEKVLRSTPTARDVVGALGVIPQTAPSTPPSRRREAAMAHQRHRRGPPVVRQVTPAESGSSSRFASAPQAPVLGNQGMNIDFTAESSSIQQRRPRTARIISAEV